MRGSHRNLPQLNFGFESVIVANGNTQRTVEYPSGKEASFSNRLNEGRD